MTDVVALVLHGQGTEESVRAWGTALAQVPATRRLVVHTEVVPPHDGSRLLAETVEVVDEWTSLPRADVLVVAEARAMPTPHALRRLVLATESSRAPHRMRALPHGPSGPGPDSPSESIGELCVALTDPPQLSSSLPSPDEVVAACTSSDVEVERLVTAAAVRGVAPVRAGAPDQPPHGHPAAIRGTALHQLLLQTGLTPPEVTGHQEVRPFLTVLTRTQGRRLLCLEETLTCLAAQSTHDFELVLACHRASPDAVADVHRLLALLPAWLQDRTTVLEVGRRGRSAPLNDALDVARGRYAVMLDDDDVVAPDWVSAFAEAEERGPGTVLRSVALAQHVRPEVVDPAEGPAPVEQGAAHPVWPAEFSLVDHLVDNASPPMTFAVPRGVFADLGHRFDESLDTTEDWDFLLRAAGVAGVTSTSAVTSTYRVWSGSEGSRHLHDDEEWASGRAAVLAGLDSRVTLMPPGTAEGVRLLHGQMEAERAEKFRIAALNEQAAADLATVNDAVTALRERIAQLEGRIERLRGRRHRGGAGGEKS